MELQELLDKKQELATVTIYDSEELLDWLNDNIGELLDAAIAKKQNGSVKPKTDASALVPAFNRWIGAFKTAKDNEPTRGMRYFYDGAALAFSFCSLTARELTFPSTPGEEVDMDKLDAVIEAFLTVARTIAGSKERKADVEPNGELPPSPFDVIEAQVED